jgi:hypothetical protein
MRIIYPQRPHSRILSSTSAAVIPSWFFSVRARLCLCARIIQRVIWSGRKRVNWQTRRVLRFAQERRQITLYARRLISLATGVLRSKNKKCALKLCDAGKRRFLCCPEGASMEFVVFALWRELLFVRRSSIEIYRPEDYGLKIFYIAMTICKYFNSSTSLCFYFQQ